MFGLPLTALLDASLFVFILLLKPSVCVKLYNDCRGQNIAVDRKGRVYAREELSHIYQNFIIKSLDFSGKLTIFGEESRRFLCFNKKWKLVGSRRYRGNFCLFFEEMLKNGYTRYRSVSTDDDGEPRYIGFTKRGKLLTESREPKMKPQFRKCLNFLKLDSDFDINGHNRQVAGTAHYTASSSSLSSYHTKIRHNHHHRQNFNEIT